MAENREREQLVREVKIIRRYTTERDPAKVESSFIRLMELDQSESEDLWQALREALGANEHLRHPEVLKFLDREDLAREGYWWYDPDQWTAGRRESSIPA